MLRRSATLLAVRSPPIRFNQGFLGVAFVQTGTTAVVETFGKYTKTVEPGLTFYIPFIQSVSAVSNMTNQATYEFETKTKDNIFTVLTVAAQVRVAPEDTVKALYTLSDAASQIHSYLDSEIRAQVSRRELDTLFSEQEEISHSVFQDTFDANGNITKESVATRLKKAGFTVERVLIRQIEPDRKVKESMNAINASLRMRDAAHNQAEAKYITEIRQAEADRDRMRLQGEGIAQQRAAIMKGYEEGVGTMTERFGLTPQEIIDFVLKTQHLDAVQQIAQSPNAKTIFTDHAPRISIKDSFMQAQEALTHSPLLSDVPTPPKSK